MIQERAGPQKVDREVVKPGGVVVRAEQGGAKSLSGAALLRAQRSLSPEGHRSSSLPPPAHRNIPPTTPSTCSAGPHTHLTACDSFLFVKMD